MPACPVVDTCNGKVIGRVIEKPFGSTKSVYNYQSIPFAKPPVGKLRFEAPQSVDNWDGIYKATSLKPMPEQDPEFWQKLDGQLPFPINEFDDDSTSTDEDCLYLNIFTTNPCKTANKPVMVWIYGGGFVMGGVGPYDGSGLAAHQDVVVVAISYRVGVLGFMSFGKGSKCPGNNGLLDQVKGLEWVRDNIQGFGGNPNNVTIFGESAGGMSVGFHVLSPMSRGLFHKAISHSGTANLKSLLQVDTSAARKYLLSQFNIPDDDADIALEKLKEVPFADMLPVLRNMLKMMMMFPPVVDGKFLPEAPLDMIKKKIWNDVPYMIGFNSTEGGGVLTMEQPVGFKDGLTKNGCKDYVKGMLMLEVDYKKTDRAADLLMEEYTKGLSPDDKYIWSRVAGDALGDINFIYAGIDMAKTYSDSGNPTFVYYMSHKFPLFHYKEYYNSHDKIKKPEFCESDHGDDLLLTFGTPLAEKLNIPVEFSPSDKALAQSWMTYIGNFAHHGNPNDGDNVARQWPEFEWEKKAYLKLRYPLETGDQIYEEKCKFWNGVIKSL